MAAEMADKAADHVDAGLELQVMVPEVQETVGDLPVAGVAAEVTHMGAELCDHEDAQRMRWSEPRYPRMTK